MSTPNEATIQSTIFNALFQPSEKYIICLHNFSDQTPIKLSTFLSRIKKIKTPPFDRKQLAHEIALSHLESRKDPLYFVSLLYLRYIKTPRSAREYQPLSEESQQTLNQLTQSKSARSRIMSVETAITPVNEEKPKLPVTPIELLTPQIKPMMPLPPQIEYQGKKYKVMGVEFRDGEPYQVLTDNKGLTRKIPQRHFESNNH